VDEDDCCAEGSTVCDDVGARTLLNHAMSSLYSGESMCCSVIRAASFIKPSSCAQSVVSGTHAAYPAYRLSADAV
jgi:hypothetical protein